MLPERPFTNPLAKAIVEQRKILSLDANRKPDVLDLIDAITLRPEDTFDNPSHYLGLMAGRTMLKMADERRPAARGRRLFLADGAGHRGRRPVGRREAAAPGAGGAEAGAGERRLRRGDRQAAWQELREAMDEFLREFAERAMQNPEHGPADAAERPGDAPERPAEDDGPDREPGQVRQPRPGAGTAVAAAGHDEQPAGRAPAAAARTASRTPRCASRWTSSARSCGASRR